jgi:hypothetical protein
MQDALLIGVAKAPVCNSRLSESQKKGGILLANSKADPVKFEAE